VTCVSATAHETTAFEGTEEPARARRADARRLAAVDPPLARELGIGRPNLRRGLDDGGLVELNTAPAAVIAHLCDLPLVVHERIRDRGIVLDVLPARR